MSDFHGLPTKSLENGHLKLDYLTTAGPRLVRLMVAGSDKNILAEVPATSVETPWGTFNFIGGHRLWHAPEAMPRTYVPDDQGFSFEEQSDGSLRLSKEETPIGITKHMDVKLAADSASLTLAHTLVNTGIWGVELAPWSITQLALGGIAILPLPTKQTGLLPNRRMSVWPYSRLTDQRLVWDEAFIAFKGDPSLPPFKIGYFSEDGWTGYYNNGVFFRKEYEVIDGLTYPDFGSNTEMFCNDEFIELEAVAAMVPLEPQDSVTMSETWTLYTDPDKVPGLTDEMRAVLSK
ncbi:MAG: hypothetical protein AB2669_02750 [Candidatus Thiodiazotropha endolucinida]